MVMFHSTRGKELISSQEAILNGLASDSGLYVIDKLPEINYHDFKKKIKIEIILFLSNTSSISFNSIFPILLSVFIIDK